MKFSTTTLTSLAAARGMAAKHMGRRLELSVLTINDHLRSAYRKAGVSGREELLARLT